MVAVTSHPIVRNVAFIGHGHSGKTTLIDMLLYKSGVNNRPGSVDDGTSFLDTDDEERQHKLSTSSHLSHLSHHEHRVNILDTPGYPDFLGHVVSALSAVETAVLAIDAHRGIEANTRKTFEIAGELGLARMIALTKCESENIDFESLRETIKDAFGAGCILMNVPAGVGPELHDIISTVHLPDEFPGDVLLDPRDVHLSLVEAAVDVDEDLRVRYLDGEEIEGDDLQAAIMSAVTAGELIPIFCTSAKMDLGLDQLMDGISDITPEANRLERHAIFSDGEDHVIEQSDKGPLVAQVFKQRIDPFVSKMSFLRVFSGVLHKDDQIHDCRSGQDLKIHQILDIQGNQFEPVDEAHAGDLVAVVKVEDLKVGDTITGNGDDVQLPEMHFPTPMIGLAVEPKSRSDQQKISSALHKIEDEDPTFTVSRDDQTHEIVMHGLSELHLNIVEERLKSRDKVEIITHQPKIAYRETITVPAEGSYRHKKQSGGSGQFAEVHLRVSPLPQEIDPETYFIKESFPNIRSYHYDAENNFAFVDRISGGSIPNQFIPAVEKGVRDRMTQGVLAGYHMQDFCVEVFFGKDHPVDSNETAFKMAGSHCLKEIAAQAKPVLLEPIVKMEISFPTDHLGDITGDINGRRGRVEGMDMLPGGFQLIKTVVPLSEVTTYARSLQGMTAGQGSFTMEFSHYETVPRQEQQKIVAAAGQ